MYGSAHDDISIKRLRDVNSKSEVSDDESTKARLAAKRPKVADADDSHGELLQQTLNLMSTRNKMQEETQRANLELAKKRDEREEEERQLRRQLQTAQLSQVVRETRMKEREQALKMLGDADPEVKEEGRRILRRLRAEEELPN